MKRARGFWFLILDDDKESICVSCLESSEVPSSCPGKTIYDVENGDLGRCMWHIARAHRKGSVSRISMICIVMCWWDVFCVLQKKLKNYVVFIGELCEVFVNYSDMFEVVEIPKTAVEYSTVVCSQLTLE